MNGGRKRGPADALTACVADFVEAGGSAESIFSLLSPYRDGLHGEAAQTQHGLALSPKKAAECVLDSARTLAFLRSIQVAISDVLARKKDVHILEAGGGPNPLSILAPAARDERVRVTSIDIHNSSVQASKNLARELGVRFTGIEADITSERWTCEDPDIIIVEAMDAGLLNEPQGAITWALAKRFGTEAIFLPEKITLHAQLNRAQTGRTRSSQYFHTLGELACIDAGFRSAAKTTPLSTALNIRRGFDVPKGWGEADLWVNTAVIVYKAFQIPPYASDITHALCFMGQNPNGASKINVVGRMGGRSFSIS